LAGLLAWGGPLLADPTYSNADIDALRGRYESRHGKVNVDSSTSALPADLAGRAYREPKYKQWFLPYQNWEKEYQNYFYRHYHDRNLTFKPSLICMHYTVIGSAQRVYNSFTRGCRMCAGDAGTVFGHVSVQLMIDRDGTVLQLLPLDRRCTGAYGVNHKALSIEMVAYDEADLLSHRDQVFSSFCLVRDLMKKFQIPLSGVIAHSDVSDGRSVVPDYLDFADSVYPDGYPSRSRRTDPGSTYMSWLRTYLLRAQKAGEL
jgi:N-acetyl-anhydromuramyl-L-alanine amidase AmpD